MSQEKRRKSQKKIKWPRPSERADKSSIFQMLIFSTAITLLIISILQPDGRRYSNRRRTCQKTERKILTEGFNPIAGKKREGETACIEFTGQSGQEIFINTNLMNLTLFTPTDKFNTGGSNHYTLEETGLYKIRIASHSITSYKLDIILASQNTSNLPVIASNSSQQPVRLPAPVLNAEQPPQDISYNIKQRPPFYPYASLESIVNEIVYLVRRRGLSTNKLSISLVDLTSNPCCAYGGYLDEERRFPASITKLFWMVALYGQYKNNLLDKGTIPETEIYKMIQDSDNEPASLIIDRLTRTQSGEDLSPAKLDAWIKNRQWVNRYFQNAGYQNINVSQKNFPVPYLGLKEPAGPDLQIRGKGVKPIRNHLITKDVARLLYEIDSDSAISPDYSQRMKEYMWRELNPEAWQKKQYNSIEGFFAESLPRETLVLSKVGWTSFSRQDAAIIASPDGSVRYILVIFGEDKGFSNDWKIFPDISRMVYNQMLSKYWP